MTGDKLHMWFRFKSSASNGLLVWIGEENFVTFNSNQDQLNLNLVNPQTMNLDQITSYQNENQDPINAETNQDGQDKETFTNVDSNQDQLTFSLGDCLSLELKEGRMVLRYNLGSGFAVLNYNSNVTYDDGEWHTVRLTR